MGKLKLKKGNFVKHSKSGYIGKVKYFVGIFDDQEYWNVDWINLPFYNKMEAVLSTDLVKVKI